MRSSISVDLGISALLSIAAARRRLISVVWRWHRYFRCRIYKVVVLRFELCCTVQPRIYRVMATTKENTEGDASK